MDNKRQISGFSKLSKTAKLKWLAENFFHNPEEVVKELKNYWFQDQEQQKVFDDFSENTLTNYILPYGVVPNVLINGKTYCVPMVTEESSVVAAAAAAAKYWMTRGGVKAEVVETLKTGQVHFKWFGDKEKIKLFFPKIRIALIEGTHELTANMEARGGGIKSIELKDFTKQEPNYYQIFAKFETCNSMGANFINSILEQFGTILQEYIKQNEQFNGIEKELDVIMCILSNYTPECIVKAKVQCKIDALLDSALDYDAGQLAERFYLAVKMAEIDTYRATTHNKGIFNGIDAVVIATGNDFRAVEADGHTFASRKGHYSSLTTASIENDIFSLTIEIPISVGTVGGLTNLHPMARKSLELLGNPNAHELMQIIAATGLLQNFSAVRSLVTTGIQQGHMKMHLMNILNHLCATEKEITLALDHFDDKKVSFSSVRSFLDTIRSKLTVNN